MKLNLLKRIFLKSVDFFLYLFCKLLRRNYSDYYAMRMNFIIYINSNWGLNLNRKNQLEYLISKGLSSNSSFLDYGCGAISAGRFFIDFLDKKKYIGIDISSSVIEEAKKRIIRFNLLDKDPLLFLAKGGKIENLPIKSFDFIWAQSVLTHMPPESVHSMFRQISIYMEDSTKFYFTFTQIKKNIRHKNFKDWAYSMDTLTKIAEKYNLVLSLETDWKHIDEDETSLDDTMVLARLG